VIPSFVKKWLPTKWRTQRDITQTQLEQAVFVCFSSFHGQLVLHHLLDSVYCTVYTGTDHCSAADLNARRSVVQELLELYDRGEHPLKYKTVIETVKEKLDARSPVV
jgi:hypothetical protein